MVILLLWWLSLYWTFSYQWPRPFDDWKNTLLYLGAGIWFGCELWRERRRHAVSLHLPLFCLFFYGLSALFSIVSANARYEGFLEIARVFLWVGLAWTLSRLKESEWMKILHVSVVSAAMISLLSLFQLKGVGVWALFYDNSIDNTWTPIGHISYYGTFMAAHFPIAIFLMTRSQKIPRKLLWGICGVLILDGLWVSGTRSSIVALVTAIFLAAFFLVQRRRISWKALILTASCFAGIVLLFQMIHPSGFRGERTVERFNFFKLSLSDRSEGDINRISSGRWSGYIATSRMIRERPLVGWGIGSYRFVFPEYDFKHVASGSSSAENWYMHPHNEVLHQWAEVGLLGLLAFIGFWISLFYGGWKRVRDTQTDRDSAAYTILAMTGLTVLFVSWQFDTNFLFPLSRLLTALYAGILWREVGPTFKTWRISLKGMQYGMIALAAFSILLLGAYQASLFAVKKCGKAQGPGEAFRWSRRAYLLAPGAFDPLYTYAADRLLWGEKERAARAVDSLYRQYPYVPAVLYQKAFARMEAGAREEAKLLLRHALSNAPGFSAAQNLLDTLENTPDQSRPTDKTFPD